MKKKYKCLNLDDYIFPGCREITGDELFRINGGGRIEPEQDENPPEEGSSSNADSYTVQSGDTLSQIVYDYNQANGTNLTVDEVAQMSGIENPDLILPGQSIVFGNSEQGTAPEQTQTVDQYSTDSPSSLSSTSQPDYSWNLSAREYISSTEGYLTSACTNSHENGKDTCIILNDTPNDQERIISMINNISYNQYGIKDNKLFLIKGKYNKSGSRIYSRAINNIMKKGYAEIKIDETYTAFTQNDTRIEIPLPVDINMNTIPGYTNYNLKKKEAYITITGKEGMAYPTKEGYANKISPEQILMHELAGHTSPIMMEHQGNAICIENTIMLELFLRNPFKNHFIPRMYDQTHVCFIEK